MFPRKPLTKHDQANLNSQFQKTKSSMSQEEEQSKPVPAAEDGEGLPPTPPATPGDEANTEGLPPQDLPPETLTPPTSPEEPKEKTPPRQIGPMPNLKKIVKESLEVIAGVGTQLDRQKHFLASSAFLVYMLQRDVEDYQEHISRLNRFLVTNHRLQERWYRTYSQVLPTYGDYSLVLKENPEKISVEGLPLPIAEGKIKEFVSDVAFNLYGGGQQVKTQRVMNKKINQWLDERREIFGEKYFHFDRWMSMLSGEVENENSILTSCFDVSSHIEFLTLGLKKD